MCSSDLVAAVLETLAGRRVTRTPLTGDVPGHTFPYLYEGAFVRLTTEVPRVRAWSHEDPHRYRLVVSLLDPTGAVVSLWEAKAHQGFGRIREPGAVTWCELITDNPDAAGAFYSAILDVPSAPMDMGPGAHPYTLFGPEDDQSAGIMQKLPEMGPMPNTWGVYFEVANTDEAVAKAQGLGAEVLQPPTDIMPGRFAMLRDPQGAVFGIIKSNWEM